MKITVIGTGYVGLVAGLGFANFGNDVICLDVDVQKIEMLNKGICPIYEPGAHELMESNIRVGRILFTADKKIAIQHGEIVFIAVGTPDGENGEAELSYVYEAARDIATHMCSYTVVVDKSTVPIGTARTVQKIIEDTQVELGKSVKFDVASNPEFLREGKAIGDFMNPDRIVLGVSSEKSKDKLLQLYKGFKRSNKPIVITTPETSEMIKYASNAFLATKIAFINEMAELCEKVGADVLEVAAAMGKDGRISPKFLHPGPGFGGACFPKDTRAIAATGRNCGAPLSIVESVISSNLAQKQRAAKKIMDRMPNGGVVAILGLSFKPDTDDVRESPAIAIIKFLAQDTTFRFRLYDPQALKTAKSALSSVDAHQLVWCGNVAQAIKGSHAIAIITEWSEFASLDLVEMKKLMLNNLFFDFRNVYKKEDVTSVGFDYIGTGV